MASLTSEMSDDGQPVFGRETIKRQSEALTRAMAEGGLEIEGKQMHLQKPPKTLPPLTGVVGKNDLNVIEAEHWQS
eukprot:CAMPEP_0169117238 /NCGR_PEP_ID=MMETSP1015-20121227/30349_1 /TAXON_ID=342587 /ORGANISM="Karlodinium micrum, Strain CCMP2283" /LENGTH=75 /DNA_ID=CAMNT_0009179903 /DNA_START=103 /DNA_END=330 /DNA_ORIENTATION=-